MKQILLVEDDNDIREALTEVLNLENYQVIPVCDGNEGMNYLNSVHENLPDLILLDLVMPVKDGYQFRNEQRTNQKLSRIPVIVMTANKARMDQDLGIQGFLKKPVSIQDLMKTIETVLLH